MKWLTIEEVLSLYSGMMGRFGQTGEVLNYGLLESAINKPINFFNYSSETVSLFDVAAIYAYGFVKNHCFIDGNKRIGFVTMSCFLFKNGILLNVDNKEVVEMFLWVASTEEKQDVVVEKLSEWLKNKCTIHN